MRERLVNRTPLTKVAADGTFARSERFQQRFANALVRYRVRFAGRFTVDGAAGTLRMRTRVLSRDGRRLRTTCDSGTQPWSVLNAGGAPAPAEWGYGTPVQRFPADWSMRWTGGYGEQLTEGRDISFAPPDRLEVQTLPERFFFRATNPDGGYQGELMPPRGHHLQAGVTYVDDSDAGIGPDSPHMNFGAKTNGCNTGTGSFVFRELAYDADGGVRRAELEWEYRCELNSWPMTGSLSIRG